MRRPSMLAASGLLVLLLSALLPATALAGSASWAWAIARHPTLSSYQPAAQDAGATYLTGQIAIKRIGTGHYKVGFPGAGVGGGVALVSPLGSSPRVCNVAAWSSVNLKLVINVRCWNYSGRKADSKFLVYFLRGQDNLGPLAYSLNYSPAQDVTLGGAFDFNSAGGVNSVHHLATGHYRVALGGLGSLFGNPQVVAYGSTPGVCRLEKWGSQTSNQSFDVNCRSLGGQRQDMRFVFVYVEQVGLYGYPPADQSAGYLWANDPTSQSYYPDSPWNWSSDAADNRVVRLSRGNYSVRLPGLSGAGGGAIVTNLGTGKLRCQLGSVASTGATQKVGVRCFKPTGAPADSQYSFIFTR